MLAIIKLNPDRLHFVTRSCRGHGRMVVGFTTTYAIIAYHH